jgi:CubicO group peptidase (beta-lactamase class C family)
MALLALAVGALLAASDTLTLEARIDEIVAPYLDARDFQGVIGVERDGARPLILPYGLASVELEVPHSANDLFMIGSVSKQFTAVAVLLLEEEGLLSTDDAVSRYLPDFPQGGRITVEQLLTHTSGVQDIYSLAEFGESGGQGGTLGETSPIVQPTSAG